MKTSQILKISFEKMSLVIIGAFSIMLCIICYAFFPQNYHDIWGFTLTHLGYMAYLLVPMTLLLLSILLHAIFEPLQEGTVWAKVVQRLEVFFPLVGLLSTFLAISLGLAELNGEEMSTQSILAIAGEICRATWGSILGVSMGMVAYVVHHDLTVKKQDSTENVTEKSVSKNRAAPQPSFVANLKLTPTHNATSVTNNAKL
jgi:hypothetical protein